MDNCCCCMTAPPHMHCGKKKENEKNIGLDFPIIFENWLKQNCTRDTHYILHSVCVFLYFLLLSLSVYFLFFSVVGFPFRRQFFSDAPSSFFCLIDILLILLPILLKPHSFSLHKSAFIHTKRYVRHVWDMY